MIVGIIMKKLVTAAFCGVLMQGQAQAQEISGTWFCRADKLISCNTEGNCQNDTSSLSALYNFDNMSAKSLNINTPVKKIINFTSGTLGASFSTAAENRITIGPKVDGLVGAFRYRVMVQLGLFSITHFGTCNRT